MPWSVLGAECLPGSSFFGLVVLFDVCVLSGKLIHSIPLPKLPPLPPLLGKKKMHCSRPSCIFIFL